MSESAATILLNSDNLQEAITAYASEVRHFLQGDVSPWRFRAYRVPFGIYEEKIEGQYMLRIRLGAGLILPHQLKRIAELSQAYGNSTLHVTTRQDIQIHGLTIESTSNVLEGLLDVGLSSLGGGGNAVRNISVCPLAGVCVDEAFDVTPHVLALTEYLLRDPTSFDLPRKFKIAFSGCPKDGSFASATDLGFFAHIKDGVKGFSVYAGGCLGSDPQTGIHIESFVSEKEIFSVTEAVILIFQSQGNHQNKLESRLHHVRARLGDEAFVQCYRKERQKVNGHGLMGELPAIRGVMPRLEPTDDVEVSQNTQMDVIQEKTPGYYTVRLNLSLGICSADHLKQIGDLASTYGCGLIRATQTQDLLLLSVPGRYLPDLEAALSALHLLTQLPSIISCVGAEGCALGLSRSRGLAKAITERLEANIQHVSENPERVSSWSRTIRISGCSSGCAQHHLADLGFEARARQVNGRLMPYYNVLVGATIREGQTRFARCIGSLPAKRIPKFVEATYEYLSLTEETLKPLIDQYGQLDLQSLSEDDYIDYDSESPFTLSDRPGGCSAAVANKIKVELEKAREALNAACHTNGQSRQILLRQAVMTTSRSLLVIFGIDDHNDQQVLDAFQSYLVVPGWVAESSGAILQKAVCGTLNYSDHEGQEVGDLIDRITVLFRSLDGSLRFTVNPLSQSQITTKQPGINRRIDLRGVACPLNFVKAKLALEAVEIGGSVVYLLDAGEAERNVQASFLQQGQKIQSIKRSENGITIQVKRER